MNISFDEFKEQALELFSELTEQGAVIDPNQWQITVDDNKLIVLNHNHSNNPIVCLLSAMILGVRVEDSEIWEGSGNPKYRSIFSRVYGCSLNEAMELEGGFMFGRDSSTSEYYNLGKEIRELWNKQNEL